MSRLLSGTVQRYLARSAPGDLVNIQDFPDRGIAENELDRKLAIAVRAAEIGIWEWDLRADQFVYSVRAKEIFGFRTDEEVTRERIIQVMHPDDHRIAREQAARSMEASGQKLEPYRYRIYRADSGELRWIHAFGEPVFETRGMELVPVRFIGTLQDVTDEVLAKEKLVQQEARLRLAVEASGIAVWEINLADQTVTHSPELNVLCGFPPEAQPSLEEFRSRYAPGERMRLERLGAEARARGETRFETEIRHLWPDGTEKWLSLRAQLAPGETGYGGRVIGALIDITAQKKREEQQALLLSEYKHRIKNSFAVTQAVVSQTLRGEEIREETRNKLFARLHALSDAHDEIASGGWESASLIAILHRASSTFDDRKGERIQIDGEDVTLPRRGALAFSLAFHELFTNAVKYGALSSDTGRVRIGLRRQDSENPPKLTILWSEHNGPAITVPHRVGFGTRLIDRVLGAEFEAEVQRDFRPEGLICSITIPLAKLALDEQSGRAFS